MRGSVIAKQVHRLLKILCKHFARQFSGIVRRRYVRRLMVIDLCSVTGQDFLSVGIIDRMTRRPLSRTTRPIRVTARKSRKSPQVNQIICGL